MCIRDSYGGLDENGEPTFMKKGDNTKYSYTELNSLALEDLEFVGTTNPPVFGSLSSNLTYKDFTLSFMITYKFGNKMRLPVPSSSTTGLYSEWFGEEFRWVEGSDNSNKWVPKLYTCLLYTSGLKVIQLVCEQGEIYLRSLTRVKLENSLELRMFCALSDSKIQAKQRFHSGDEIYRLSSDVGVVAESVAFTFPILVYSIVQLIATWGYLITMQPLLTMAIGLIAPIIVFAGYHYTRLLVPVSRDVYKRQPLENY